MDERYYLLDSVTYTDFYKQKRPIKLSDVDQDKFIICKVSTNIGRAVNQYGMSEDVTKVLYTRLPFALEESTDAILDENKYISDLVKVYEVISIKKESLTGEYLYIIGIDEVQGAI